MYRNVFLGAILLSMPLVVWSQQDTIADQRLEEIMVTAKLPLVEISAGKTSYRMDASVTQSTGSLYDVLASLPGVVIDSNGNILLNGQSGATILMDGKPTYLSGDELMSLLKSTPATNADKIDLITQPSARHDAAGSSGLIDIRTRKIRLRGVNLALNGNGSLGRTGGGYGGVSMNVRENKFNLYLNYSYYQGKDVIDLFIDRAFDQLYWHFFYHRHNDFWKAQAFKRLTPLVASTEMLVCGEDLGMIPASVPEVMNKLQILSLEIERMPKSPQREFSDMFNLPYHSVCTTSTHDMTPLRNWWKEDPEKTQRYYNHVLQRIGEAPDECTAEIVAQIISNHLKTRSMLTIIPLQDWFAMDDSIKRKDIESERINVPANSTHYWRYRMHITLEQLLQADNLNNKIVSLIKEAGRK